MRFCSFSFIIILKSLDVFEWTQRIIEQMFFGDALTDLPLYAVFDRTGIRSPEFFAEIVGTNT